MDDNANPILNNHGCGAIQPNKYIDNLRQGYLTLEWYVESGTSDASVEGNVYRQTMNPDLVLSLFKRISEEDALVLGFHKSWCLPHWMIMQSVIVVPPACRPSVRQYNGQRSEDDITHKYYDIVKYNNELKEMMNNPNPVPEEHLEYKTMTLQFHVSTLMNNEDNKNPAQSLTRAFRPIKGITERLKGKDGRIRNNLMGKRVDFSARSVISPDANIRMSELGVPKEIAMNLTYPEIVCKYNINEMYKLIRNGNNVYPGAKSVKYAKTGRIRLLIDSNLEDIVLEYGDIVNRHLRDGDYVLFNRQPSLHKMSMMGHRIRVMSGKTFRFNPDVCSPYNADKL
jgi:DNA-directed RNA polymerase II subunit RPB1